MPRVIKAVPHENHTLTIELANHHSIIYDLRPRLQSTRFCALADIHKFQAVRVEHENTLVWNSLCQITIDEILDLLDR